MVFLPLLLFSVGLVSIFIGFYSIVGKPMPKGRFLLVILPLGLIFTLCGILLFFVPHFFGF
jgi:hypothetical protein